MESGGKDSRAVVASGAALIALTCVVAASTPATGSDARGAQSRLAPAPQLEDLRLTPTTIDGGSATIRFSLDRAGDVALVRLRSAGTESGKGFVSVTDRPIAGEAGLNKDVVSARQMGTRPGRYVLRAQTLGGDPDTGDFASVRYRIVR